MRLLFLSNFYPPDHNGGYEQLCEETARALRRMGHSVRILTSCPPEGSAPSADDDVDTVRRLNLEVIGGLANTTLRLLRDRTRLERENVEILQELVTAYRPDAVLVWGMWNVPRSSVHALERLASDRVVYYCCDYWPSLPSAYLQQWQEPARNPAVRLPKHLLGLPFRWWLSRTTRPPLRLDRFCCVSGAVRDGLVEAGVDVRHARIVHNGIDLAQFEPRGLELEHARSDRPLRLLYAGRLSREKGVATAIRAMAALSAEPAPPTLDLLGHGEPGYEGELRQLVASLGVSSRVSFRAGVPRAQMPATIAEYDALLFPSEWPEPMARIIMEAMAVGLVVVGTTTGGTGDLLRDGETGLTFPPGDSAALAEQIRRLRAATDLGMRLSSEARRRVEEGYTFERMVSELEGILTETAESAERSEPATAGATGKL